tara:strand:+ start:1369 stop:2499 length:1131 start_codon:yes stop_codon:yes gene_type:complete
MAVLKSTNVQGALCVNGVAVGGAKDFKFCCFTASTNFTPSQDLVDGNAIVDAVLVGGGGAGGGAGITCASVAEQMGTRMGAGGGGATAIRRSFPITATTNCAVVIGAGGVGAILSGECIVGTAGTFGGCTTFGGDLVGGGGPGATFLANAISGRIYNGGNCSGVGGGGMVRDVERLSKFNAAAWNPSPGPGCNSGEFQTGFRPTSACKCACKKALITGGTVDPASNHWESTCCATVNYATQTCNSPSVGNKIQEGFLAEKGIDSWGDGTRYAGTLHNTCDYGPGFYTGSSVGDGASADGNCWYARWRGEGGSCDFGKLSTGNGACHALNNSTHKGFGAVGAKVGICTCYPRNNCIGCAFVDGMSGNDGVVVIKWFQ